LEGNNETMLVTLPNDTVVHAQGRLGLISSERPRAPDFALYLDERWLTDPEVSWPYRLIAWPDFGLPIDEGELFEVIVNIHDRAISGELVEIACYGGLGRTGTVLSCVAICAGVPLRDAVAWVRIHYDQRAVESQEQYQLIERFARSL
jgi:hypothetical protein